MDGSEHPSKTSDRSSPEEPRLLGVNGLRIFFPELLDANFRPERVALRKTNKGGNHAQSGFC